MCSLSRTLLFFCICVVWSWGVGLAWAENAPDVPRVDSLVMSPSQPQQADEAVVWYDDFDGPEKTYTESRGGLDENEAFGGQGRSMLSALCERTLSSPPRRSTSSAFANKVIRANGRPGVRGTSQ